MKINQSAGGHKMKRFIVSMAMVLVLCSGAWAADCETITVADTAIGFTAATYQIPAGFTSVEAYCCNETAQVRVWYDDDTSPTDAIGIVINAGDCFWLRNNWDMPYLKAIRTGASSGSLTCCYSFSR